MKKITLFIITALFMRASPSKAQADIQLTDLRCEYRVNPLGIDQQKPRFTWTFYSPQRNQYQIAYEILVDKNLQVLENANATTWSTGRVNSSENTLIEYGGQPLESFTRYYWRVRIYDKNGQVSAWSAPAWFETAMLNPEDWKGKWVGDGKNQFERDEDFYSNDPMPLFRKEVEVKRKIAEARLYIAGIGYYEAYINGKKISDHVLDPGWTTYKEEILYVVHDITGALKLGQNVAGIMLGNGWWNPLPLRLFRRFNLRDFQETGRPCVKAEIHIRYVDGTQEIIPTDGTWQTAPGPIVRNNVYLGEHYDAQQEQKNWNGLHPILREWKNATLVSGPSGVLRPQQQPPIRVTRLIKPVSVKKLSTGIFIVDMGQNFAGVARIKVRGKAGTRVTLRYGEALHPDGTLNYLTTVAGQIKEIWHLSGGPGAPATAWQEDSYTLKGSGEETWSPRFTFHGFRYVEITGWPGTPTVNDIEGLRMNSDLQPTGTFACSNTLFNKVHEAIQWTFLSNVFSVQSDCPGREKMGYGADMVTTANAFLFNYDMSTFYSKAVQDYANEQQPDGGITEIAPYTGIHDKGVGGESGPLGWQLAFSYLQERLYEFYGDERIIEQHYPAVVKQMEFLQAKAVDGLFYWDISDHVAIDPKPEAFSASAFYFHHALLAAKFAGILDKKEDSVKYTRLSQQIKKNIVAKYLVPKTGRFDNATQSAQLFALWYDFAPDKEKAMQVLMDEFERHHWHVSSGIFGVMMMFDVLRENDRQDVAYRLASQPDYPGWGYMLGQGATTLWESWEYPDNGPSQNHPMFGSIDEWFYRSLLGINPAAPGFRKIIIKPQPAGDLTWAKGSYSSIHGNIGSEWSMTNSRFISKVSIPTNTRAEIWILNKENKGVTEGGKLIGENPEFKVRNEGGYTVIDVGSGEYTFERQP